MRFNLKGLIVTAAGLLVAWLAIEAGAAAVVDAVLLAGWGLVLILGTIAIVMANARGRHAIGQHGAFRELRRWFRNS